MEKLPITIVIIAKNEEKRLPDCLASVSWAQEIVVVDDESTDATVAIAEKAGAKVFQRKMDREGPHRNFAIAQGTQEWILSLDADERVTPELYESLKVMLAKTNDPYVCYNMPVRTFIGDLFLDGAGHYPAPKTRVYRKGKFSYKDEQVHPPVSYEGSCGSLTGDILHFTAPSFEAWFAKFNRETTLEAKKWIAQKREVSSLEAVRKAWSRFLKNYFQKGGISKGFTGYLMCCIHALYQLMSYAKYRELKKHPHIYDKK